MKYDDMENGERYIHGQLAKQIHITKDIFGCSTFAEASKTLARLLDEVVDFDAIEGEPDIEILKRENQRRREEITGPPTDDMAW